MAQGRWGAIEIRSATLLPGEVISVAWVTTGPRRTSRGKIAPTPPPSAARMNAQRRSSLEENNSPASR